MSGKSERPWQTLSSHPSNVYPIGSLVKICTPILVFELSNPLYKLYGRSIFNLNVRENSIHDNGAGISEQKYGELMLIVSYSNAYVRRSTLSRQTRYEWRVNGLINGTLYTTVGGYTDNELGFCFKMISDPSKIM